MCQVSIAASKLGLNTFFNQCAVSEGVCCHAGGAGACHAASTIWSPTSMSSTSPPCLVRSHLHRCAHCMHACIPRRVITVLMLHHAVLALTASVYHLSGPQNSHELYCPHLLQGFGLSSRLVDGQCCTAYMRSCAPVAVAGAHPETCMCGGCLRSAPGPAGRACVRAEVRQGLGPVLQDRQVPDRALPVLTQRGVERACVRGICCLRIFHEA